MANLAQFFAGTPSSISQVPRFTNQQQGLMNALLQQGQQGLQNPYAGFQPIAQRARSQFQQQVVPGIAEQFSSLGNSALSSPAFASRLGQAGAGLEEALAAQEAQFGQQNIAQLLQMLQLGLMPQFENIPIGGQQGAGAPLIQSLFQAAVPALFGGIQGGISGRNSENKLADTLFNILGGAAKAGLAGLASGGPYGAALGAVGGGASGAFQ